MLAKTFMGEKLEVPITEKEYHKRLYRLKRDERLTQLKAKEPCKICGSMISKGHRERHIRTVKCQRIQMMNNTQLQNDVNELVFANPQ
jgi:hypothetical protein